LARKDLPGNALLQAQVCAGLRFDEQGLYPFSGSGFNWHGSLEDWRKRLQRKKRICL